jgi:hypothetical protein
VESDSDSRLKKIPTCGVRLIVIDFFYVNE